MSLEARVRSLSPLRFQALALILLRKEFGDGLEDVRDTSGEGNGCDGILVSADHVEAFQVRTVEREFGDTQKRKAREAIDLALEAIPDERGLPLKKFTFVFNLDLQPSEAKWFAGQKAKYSQSGCTVEYRTLGWVVSKLLDEANAGIRREFVESESDRQSELLRAIAHGGQISTDALQKVISLVQGLAANEDAKRALETLLERSKFHFEAGLASLAVDSFRNANVALSEARELLKRHQEDPLYFDVVYWQAVALLRANDWKNALAAFEEAERLYRKVGRVEEALWAKGNQGHALRGLGRKSEALAIFQTTNAAWLEKKDTYNILTGYLNEAEMQMELGDLRAAQKAFDTASAVIERLSAPEMVDLELFDLMLHFFASIATYYFAVENDDAALGSLEVAIKLARQSDRKHFLGKAIASSISPLTFTGRIDEALQRAEEAEQLLLEVGDDHGLGTLYNNVGVAYLEKRDIARAGEYFTKDYEICLRLGDHGGAEKTLATMRQYGCQLPRRTRSGRA